MMSLAGSPPHETRICMLLRIVVQLDYTLGHNLFASSLITWAWQLTAQDIDAHAFRAQALARTAISIALTGFATHCEG